MKPYRNPHPSGNGFRVGAYDPDSDYSGPEAHVHADATWVYVSTDDYDGCAMLNVESLPALIEALQAVLEQHPQ